MDERAELLVEQLPRARRVLRVAVVTETYPPDVNDVAARAASLVEGLGRRNHDVQLVRPRRPEFRLGWSATRTLARLWSRSRPDVVHVLTQGPLGWAALRAARQVKVPVISDFDASFSRRYGA